MPPETTTATMDRRRQFVLRRTLSDIHSMEKVTEFACHVDSEEGLPTSTSSRLPPSRLLSLNFNQLSSGWST
ncbi:hypothetical protein J6590_038573 [Homalodisca vitripennis]|nr:hypothetical protein J6590_038573 [Homalodisca vitripennis]